MTNKVRSFVRSLPTVIVVIFKCHYDEILDTQFFTFSYTIGLSLISCQISIYFKLSFRKFTAAINFPCSESWLRIRQFLKNTTRVEIIRTINVENCSNIWAKAFFILYANCCTNCYFLFQLVCYFWENNVIFSNSQPRLGTRKIMTTATFSERKAHKTWVHFGKISRKDLFCTKM